MFGLDSLPAIVTAVGGLGTAAFGLVDATKVFDGGANHIGFAGIKAVVTTLTPPSTGTEAKGLTQAKILDTLQANWFNGTDLASQKAIAKSLIKLNLSPTNAATLAAVTGVDPATLTAIAESMAKGTSLYASQADVFARLDLSVTALLDEAYQRSDQAYRNGTRALATVAALILSLWGGIILHLHGGETTLSSWGIDILESLLVGLMATPLAPIAKDISTALATAVNTMQAVKK
jgi:hypothetical protein